MFRLIINFEINNWIHLFESLGFFVFGILKRVFSYLAFFGLSLSPFKLTFHSSSTYQAVARGMNSLTSLSSYYVTSANW